MDDFVQIVIISQNTEILIESNYWLGMYKRTLKRNKIWKISKNSVLWNATRVTMTPNVLSEIND